MWLADLVKGDTDVRPHTRPILLPLRQALEAVAQLPRLRPKKGRLGPLTQDDYKAGICGKRPHHGKRCGVKGESYPGNPLILQILIQTKAEGPRSQGNRVFKTVLSLPKSLS